MERDRIVNYVVSALQLSMLLEVSGYPKPGNIDRFHDFKKTTYENFLGSIACLGGYWRKAAEVGYDSKIRAQVGQIIYGASIEVLRWQTNGNTSFGTILLLTPLAIAAGSLFKKMDFDKDELKRILEEVINATTPRDAVNVYKAIGTIKPGGLGSTPQLDVKDKRSIAMIKRKTINLKDVFQIASKYDSISKEWCTGFSITFEIGYPHFIRTFQETKSVNTATVHTFLRILSEIPDTLITRKKGEQKATAITNKAKKILKAGGLSTEEGRRYIEQFDKTLRREDNSLNPGTTADLTCSSIAVAVLSGFRP